jgi:hypothetical protein
VNSSNRRRALDEVEATKDRWIEHNPLFKSAIPQFDEAFNRGVPLNLDHYVCRQGKEMCQVEEAYCDLFFSTHLNPTGKVYVLQGPVGAGKTSFVRYLTDRVIPARHKNALSVYIDSWQLFTDDGTETAALHKACSRAIENSVTRGPGALFSNQQEFFSAALNFLGYSNLSHSGIFELGRKLEIPDVLKYLFLKTPITHFLFAVDNIDESSLAAIQAGRGFVTELAHLCREYSGGQKSSCVLLPVREYTANKFSDTDRFAHKELPPIDEATIISAKLEQARSSIDSIASEFSGEVSFTMNIPGSRDQSIRAAQITIKKEAICSFLQELAEEIVKKDHEMLSLLRKLSAGNLKILVGNVYNMLHSTKLPLTELFQRRFIPDEAPELRRPLSNSPLKGGRAFECLLAIHYPFYDVAASHLMNVFNVVSSKAPNDFRNTLTIPRLLCLLLNGGRQPKRDIVAKFSEVGYSEKYVEAAIRKCLNYGLISSDHGFDVEHFQSNTVLWLSTAGEAYLETLIIEPSYLQYVCEDTPMPDQYCIPITTKYRHNRSHGSVEQRLRSILSMIAFLQEEEKMEHQSVVIDKRVDEGGFLFQMSVRRGNHGIRLSQHLKDHIEPKVKTIQGMPIG